MPPRRGRGGPRRTSPLRVPSRPWTWSRDQRTAAVAAVDAAPDEDELRSLAYDLVRLERAGRKHGRAGDGVPVEVDAAAPGEVLEERGRHEVVPARHARSEVGGRAADREPLRL